MVKTYPKYVSWSGRMLTRLLQCHRIHLLVPGLFPPVVFSSGIRDTVHHSYISTCSCGKHLCTCKLALKVPHATNTQPNMTVSMTPHVLEWAMHPARLAMEVERVHSLEIHTRNGRTMTNVDSANLSGKQHFSHCAHYAADNSAGHSQKCCQKKLDL